MGNGYSSEGDNEFGIFDCPCSTNSYQACGIPELPATPCVGLGPLPKKPPTPPPVKTSSPTKHKEKESTPALPQCKKESPPARIQLTLQLVGDIGNYAPAKSFFSLQVLTGLISCTCCSNRAVTATAVSFFGFLSLLSCFTDLDEVDFSFKFLSFWKPYCRCRCTDCCCRREVIKWSDLFHAIVSLGVYVLFAVSDQNIMDSFFPCLSRGQKQGLQWGRLLAVFILGAASSWCPTNRKGVGFAVVEKILSKDRPNVESRPHAKTQGCRS